MKKNHSIHRGSKKVLENPNATRFVNHHHQQSYEPEPVPAFLVSSLEKEWMAVSPYAIKFWDKLNLEPYAKQKNIAYLVVVPDFDTEIFDNFSSFLAASTTAKSNEEKDYINYFLKWVCLKFMRKFKKKGVIFFSLHH